MAAAASSRFPLAIRAATITSRTGEAIQLPLPRQLPQHALEKLDGPERFAPVERQAGATDLRRLIGVQPVEQLRSLLGPALPPPELGEYEARARRPRRA
jgi:hypothetical protein